MNTIFIGKVAQHFPSLISTNDFAVDLIAKTKPIEGTVISAGFQQKGKGQIGRSWFSSPNKNLLLSIILYPKWLLAQDQFALSQAIALGVADAIYSLTSKEVTVKWPNDVYVGDQKIAGILIQNGLLVRSISWSVIGMGVNINEEEFPDDLPRATSLKMITGDAFDLDDVKNKLFQSIEQRYLQLKSKPKVIAGQYLERLYQYQTWASYKSVKTGEVFKGQIIGVNKHGHLAVQKEDSLKKIEYYDLKEIVFLTN